MTSSIAISLLKLDPLVATIRICNEDEKTALFSKYIFCVAKGMGNLVC